MKKMILKIIEKLLPFTVVSSYNINANPPGYIREFARIIFKRKVYVFGKKINNLKSHAIKIKTGS